MGGSTAYERIYVGFPATFESLRLRHSLFTPVRPGSRTGVVTFRQAFATFFDIKKKSLSNAKHLRQWPATMTTYAFPRIGDRPVAEIQTSEILEVLARVWFETPETGRRLLQRIVALARDRS